MVGGWRYVGVGFGWWFYFGWSFVVDGFCFVVCVLMFAALWFCGFVVWGLRFMFFCLCFVERGSCFVVYGYGLGFRV